MIKVLVFGAGAIGRGYLPWIFPVDTHILDYVESNQTLLEELRRIEKYTSYMTKDSSYHQLAIDGCRYFSLTEVNSDLLNSYDFIATAVGPRQFLSLAKLFQGTDVPIVCFENDRDLVLKMRLALDRDNIYFGIPDVISSNTSSESISNASPMSLITEDGVCFVEEAAQALAGDVKYVSETEMSRQWAAKLYIHNTPHCIAAYLGSLAGVTYLHEAMQLPEINRVVRGAANEMKHTVENIFDLDEDFSQYYLDKEIARFENQLLYDPISRIAREPFRKLALDNRLIGAASFALSVGVSIEYLMIGITAAFRYDDSNDPDHHIKPLYRALSKGDFLEIAIGLHKNEPVYRALYHNWGKINEYLDEI